MTEQERLKIFSEIETGAVTDAMVQHQVGCWMKGIFPTEPGMKIYGRARTAQFSYVVPPDTEMNQFEIIERCSPGEVMVWNVPSEANICGENIMHFLGNHQLGGLIIDGYTRDVETIKEMGVPQFTRGAAIAPAPRNCRVVKRDLDVPVNCGGAVVQAGDYVFGDSDGVLVVPEEHIDLILNQAILNMEYEKRMEEAINKNADSSAIAQVFKTKVLYKEETHEDRIDQ